METPTKTLVTTREDLDKLAAKMELADMVGLDTETNGKWSRYEVGLVGISVGLPGEAYYIPLTHVGEGTQLDTSVVLDRLKAFLENTNSNYVWHNAKFDETVMKVYGIECRGSGDDTMVMSWLLQEEGKHGLKLLVKEVLGIQMETYEDVITKNKIRGQALDYNFALVALNDALSYAADDAFYTRELYLRFKPELERQGLWQAYINIERPLLRVVRDMEYRGLLVDQKAVAAAREKFPRIMSALEEEILEDIGQPINIDSPKQLGVALYDILQVTDNPPVTATGQYKTDKKTLELYASRSPAIEKVLHRKKIKKTYDVFVEGLGPHILEGRVHPQFHSTGTVSGRFSSSRPNAQQIQGDEVEEIKVRDFFVPADGNTYVVGDFGQVELRVMAHHANDATAIAAFLSGRDFHSETARAMFKLGPDIEPSARQRFYAKSLNFGIPYGRGPNSVAEQLGIDACCCGTTLVGPDGRKIHAKGCWGGHCGACSRCYIEIWYEGFPNVKPFKEQLLKTARQRGYIRTLAGRKRRLPNLNSPDGMLRSGAERQAFNTLCQGGAADIIKAGMVAAVPELKRLEAQILLQIHDELLVEAPIERAEEVVETLNRIMEHPINGQNPLRLPLKFEPKIVTRWSQAK